MSGGKGGRRRALKVLTSEILCSKSKNNTNKTGQSVSAFVRDRRIMMNAREISRKNHRARKLDIPSEEYPITDPIWRKYQNTSVNIDDFDLKSCENDDLLVEFGKEIVKHLEAAEMAPDDGIPINFSLTLPRSFLLDAIHFSASMQCLNLQKQAGKPFQRSECPSPIERAKSMEGFGERYVSTIKTIFQKTKKKWIAINNGLKATECSDDETTDIGPEPSIDAKSIYESSPDDPDFEAIMNEIIDLPEMFEAVPAYEFQDCNEFGADSLWSFDTSSLLAFGVLAEEFISSMIDYHLEYNETLKMAEDDDECDSISEVSHISTDISCTSSDFSEGESIDQ